MTNPGNELQELLKKACEKARLEGFAEGHKAGVNDALKAMFSTQSQAAVARLIDSPTSPATPISELGLNVRIIGCFRREGIRTIGDLTERSRADLNRLPKFGDGSLLVVERELARHGLTLRGEQLPSNGNLSSTHGHEETEE